MRQVREKINTYREEYCQLASYAPIKLATAQQIAIYESTKIHTTYINNVALHFGNCLRMFLNKVLRKKRKEGEADSRYENQRLLRRGNKNFSQRIHRLTHTNPEQC
ncbi:hypothetical protein K7432_016194 [Basidiobolus ranarum]|uniref:Uncharacterized protein n=1 Tax=Basidiobolus ranarum TaxID=34480 RepID=A0ABR2VM07_9FUNG